MRSVSGHHDLLSSFMFSRLELFCFRSFVIVSLINTVPGSTPQHGELFQDIAQYTSNLQSRVQTQSSNEGNISNQQAAVEQPLAKKRKLENGKTATTTTSIDDKDAPLQFYAQDISFAVPQRKKLTLEISAAGGFLRARNQVSKNIEFGVALQDIGNISRPCLWWR